MVSKHLFISLVSASMLATSAVGCAAEENDEDAETEDLGSTENAVSVAQKCDDASIWGAHSLPCVEYTGSWPSGKVRASAGPDYHSIKLQTCSAPGTHVCNNYVDVSGSLVVGKARSAWFSVSKYGMYRTCVRVAAEGKWACMRQYYVPYLGD